MSVPSYRTPMYSSLTGAYPQWRPTVYGAWYQPGSTFTNPEPDIRSPKPLFNIAADAFAPLCFCQDPLIVASAPSSTPKLCPPLTTNCGICYPQNLCEMCDDASTARFCP